MSRLVVVSGTARTAIGLSLAGHDVIDLRPDAIDLDAETANEVDAVVLDVDTTGKHRVDVDALRRTLPQLPTLVVNNATRSEIEAALTKLLGTRPEPAAAPPRRPSPAELVRDLTKAAESLFTVDDAAHAAVSEAIERTASDAGLVLVADGPAWRVSGGVGLRPVELRARVDMDAWLVVEATCHDWVVVDNAGRVHPQLQGAPLARYPCLLAVALPGADGILVLGRETPPYTDDEINAILGMTAEAAGLLNEALDVRDLARRLAEFRDDPAEG
jgi:hypothetical protein